MSSENPYDHLSERGGPAPVMQRSYDRPAGLDNPRAPPRGPAVCPTSRSTPGCS